MCRCVAYETGESDLKKLNEENYNYRICIEREGITHGENKTAG